MNRGQVLVQLIFQVQLLRQLLREQMAVIPCNCFENLARLTLRYAVQPVLLVPLAPAWCAKWELIQ